MKTAERSLRVLCLTLGTLGWCALSACGTPRHETTPLSEAILGFKAAVVTAQETAVFEEFVKYKELEHTVALNRITNVRLEVDSNMLQSAKTGSEVNLATVPVGGVVGLGTELNVENSQGGTISLEMTPLESEPEAYRALKRLFDETEASAIYGLLWYDAEIDAYAVPRGNAVSGGEPRLLGTRHNPCVSALYCLPIAGLRDSQNRPAFAYLKDLRAFRRLLDQMRQLEFHPSTTQKP